MSLETLTALAVLDFVRDWIWAPFITIILSAIGLHIKADRDARKQHLEDVKELHERINEEHLRVEDHYVTKETLLSAIKQIDKIAEDVKHIRQCEDKRNGK